MPTTAPATFVWDDSCVVGVRVIDAQHMRLVAMINNLHDATLFGGGQKKISRTLDDLLGYTQAHFAVEERLMEGHGFPGLVVHKRVHAELTVQVQALMREYASEGPEICGRLKEFLGEWLLKHIKGMDKRVGEFLTRQGVR